MDYHIIASIICIICILACLGGLIYDHFKADPTTNKRIKNPSSKGNISKRKSRKK